MVFTFVNQESVDWNKRLDGDAQDLRDSIKKRVLAFERLIEEQRRIIQTLQDQLGEQ
jgi:hypothetical protein